MTDLLFAIGAVLLGLVLGTIVAAMAIRIPSDRPLLALPSCVRSGEKLQLGDYLPLIGFLLQRGVCRHCGKPLPRWFPLVEVSMAGLALLAFFVSDSPLRFALYTAILAILLLIIAIDVRLHEIYFMTLVAGAVVALVAALFLPEIDLVNALIGAAVGGGFFGIIYLVARAIYKTEALGFGDVLLAILLGLISGFPGVVSTLFWGPIIGGAISIVLLLARRKGLRDYFPYAPGLCLAQIGFLLTRLNDEPLWDTLRLPILGEIIGYIGVILWKLITGPFS